jgi:hypothetical protein
MGPDTAFYYYNIRLLAWILNYTPYTHITHLDLIALAVLALVLFLVIFLVLVLVLDHVLLLALVPVLIVVVVVVVVAVVLFSWPGYSCVLCFSMGMGVLSFSLSQFSFCSCYFLVLFLVFSSLF